MTFCSPPPDLTIKGQELFPRVTAAARLRKEEFQEDHATDEGSHPAMVLTLVQSGHHGPEEGQFPLPCVDYRGLKSAS